LGYEPDDDKDESSLSMFAAWVDDLAASTPDDADDDDDKDE
jgi:hypothetical protein